jgi:hypothetical protein
MDLELWHVNTSLGSVMQPLLATHTKLIAAVNRSIKFVLGSA